MRVLNLLGLLLVATRPARSVTTETGHGWGEPLGSDQANAATKIASSTFSDTMSPRQEWAMLHDETQDINRVDPFGESSSMNVEWDSSPGSEIDASHISIDSQQLSQHRDNRDCLIDLNRIPIESEILPSKDLLENFVPDNRNAHQFGSSFKNLADGNPSTSSNRDASRISIDGQQSFESGQSKTFNFRIENTINSKNQPVDVHENFVPDGFPEHAQKFNHFDNALGLRKLWSLLKLDLDEVKDYKSLCVFLGKETNPQQGRKPVEIGQNNIHYHHPRLNTKATSTLQKLIEISNYVLKLSSCGRLLDGISAQDVYFLKRTCIPVLQCLVNCCGKDMDLFQTRWGTHFNHRDFGFKCCPGRRSNHNTCGYLRTKIVRNPDNSDKDSGLLLDLNALVGAVSTSKTAE